MTTASPETNIAVIFLLIMQQTVCEIITCDTDTISFSKTVDRQKPQHVSGLSLLDLDRATRNKLRLYVACRGHWDSLPIFVSPSSRSTQIFLTGGTFGRWQMFAWNSRSFRMEIIEAWKIGSRNHVCDCTARPHRSKGRLLADKSTNSIINRINN